MKNKKTKWLIALLSAALVVSMVGIAAFAAESPTITVGTATAAAGETVDVDITVSGNPGIVNMMLDVSFDTSVLTLTKVTDAKILGASAHSDQLTSPYRLSWSDDTASENITANGKAVTLTFAVNKDAKDGSYPISVSYDGIDDAIYDIDFEDVSFAVVNGAVTVGHTHDLTKTAAVEATCEKDGSIEYYTCSVCEKMFSDAAGTKEITASDITVPKKGHTLTKTAAVDATCQKEGNIEYYTCSVCGKLFSDAAGTKEIAEKDTVLAKVDHQWGDWTVTKEATETAEGERTRTCAVGGETETQAIPKLNHVHNLTKVDAVAATCEEDGNIEYYTCSGCDLLFKDAAGTEEVAQADVVVAALGHNWDEGTVTKEATCEEAGEMLYTCQNDATHTKTEVIEALGHDWGEWVVVKEATKTEEGLKERVCQRDASHKEEQTIDKLKSGGSSSGGGSGTTTPTNAVTPATADNGSVSVSPSKAKEGDTVTVTPKADAGYEVASVSAKDASGKAIRVKDNGDGTYSFTMPGSKVSVEATFAKSHDCPAKPFTDVDTTQWYHEDIDFVLEKGVMNGTGATTFAPNGTITRGMIVTILHRLEGTPEAAASAFTDVEAGSWYEAAVNWAAAEGVVKGISETSFAPNAPITREQFATILYRYAEHKGVNVSKAADLSKYTDANAISAYAVDAMSWANAEGLITGMTDTTLAPAGNATRAQAAAIFHRAYDKITN